MEIHGVGALVHGPDGEVRHATIVKCDIVGSTGLKKTLDLDGQLEFKYGWEGTVTSVAGRHEGRVETFEGDGALVVFGHPESREDMAECAVRMALDLVGAVTRVPIGTRTPLQVRVGIATGPVAAIRNAAVPHSEAVAGLTIDMAERLRALAAPGGVVIADATRKLAGGFFEYEDLGVVTAKGFDEGMRAWRVVRASPVASRFEAQRFDPANARIVGRADAQARLARAWEEARAGRGGAIALVGDAGIGKSRLARDVLDRAGRDDAVVLEIDCTPSTRNTPLFPIGILLRRSAGVGDDMSEPAKREVAERLLARFLAADEVAPALGYVGPLFGLEASGLPTDASPTDVRDRTIELVTGLLDTLARDKPVAMLCEDLHWVDDTTAAVLGRIAARIGALRALLVVTSRERVILDADGAPGVTTIALPPLDEDAAETLVRAVAGDALSDDRIRDIVRHCEGVPLVLEEVARSAVETTRVGAPAERQPFANAAPGALELVVQSRLSRRPDLAVIAQTAAVLGRDFPLPVLGHLLARLDEQALVQAIDALAGEGLVERPDGAVDVKGRARFKHVMIREAVYNTLLGGDRARMHSSAADALATAYRGTPDAAPDVVAEHLRRAHRFAECIRLRLAASVDTAARGAYVETEGHCEAALALVDRVTDAAERRTLEFGLLIQLGVALAGRHGYSAAKVEDVYRRARAACGDSAEAERLYPILRALTAFNLVRGQLAAGHELSLQSLEVAEQSQRAEFRIDAMSVHCYATLYFGRLDECRTWIERCLALYDEAEGHRLTYPVPNDAATAAHALLPTVLWLTGHPDAAERAIDAALRHAERVNRDFDRAMTHAWIAGVRYTQRRNALALQHAAIAIEVARTHGYREWLGVGSLLALLAQSLLEPAPAPLEQATGICTALASEGVGLNASYYLWGLARGYQRLGALDAARGLLEEAFRRARASGETRMDAELLMLQASLESESDRAPTLLRQALDSAAGLGDVVNALRASARIVAADATPSPLQPLALETLAVLEGDAAPPGGPDWMHERLRALRAAATVA